MADFFYWSGAILWSAVALLVLYIVWLVLRHAADATIFTVEYVRTRKLLDGKLHLSRWIPNWWASFWHGPFEYVVVRPNSDPSKAGIAIYWPGHKEEDERP